VIEESSGYFYWMRGEGGRLSPNFHSSEFECKCGKCHLQCTSIVGVESLEYLRVFSGSGRIRINSAFRCFYHNSAVGGVSSSFHLTADAWDIKHDHLSTEELYYKAKSLFTGFGLANTFLHVDKRKGPPAFWTYGGYKGAGQDKDSADSH